ncbi:hypothetical protein PR048_007519 [Dryococelus australis]|uniref:Uncharacterized protein n=1 Tax=Dryococelus australis TaxID=614101 RepID=A0ABQ9HUH9_9NEOP|nr:hypothetical protein PR048_007519 [Dryococelus australis]
MGQSRAACGMKKSGGGGCREHHHAPSRTARGRSNGTTTINHSPPPDGPSNTSPAPAPAAPSTPSTTCARYRPVNASLVPLHFAIQADSKLATRHLQRGICDACAQIAVPTSHEMQVESIERVVRKTRRVTKKREKPHQTSRTTTMLYQRRAITSMPTRVTDCLCKLTLVRYALLFDSEVVRNGANCLGKQELGRNRPWPVVTNHPSVRLERFAETTGNRNQDDRTGIVFELRTSRMLTLMLSPGDVRQRPARSWRQKVVNNGIGASELSPNNQLCNTFPLRERPLLREANFRFVRPRAAITTEATSPQLNSTAGLASLARHGEVISLHEPPTPDWAAGKSSRDVCYHASLVHTPPIRGERSGRCRRPALFIGVLPPPPAFVVRLRSILTGSTWPLRSPVFEEHATVRMSVKQQTVWSRVVRSVLMRSSSSVCRDQRDRPELGVGKNGHCMVTWPGGRHTDQPVVCGRDLSFTTTLVLGREYATSGVKNTSNTVVRLPASHLGEPGPTPSGCLVENQNNLKNKQRNHESAVGVPQTVCTSEHENRLQFPKMARQIRPARKRGCGPATDVVVMGSAGRHTRTFTWPMGLGEGEPHRAQGRRSRTNTLVPLLSPARTLYPDQHHLPHLPRLAVHDKVSTFETDLRKKPLPLPAYILTSALSDIRPVKASGSTISVGRKKGVTPCCVTTLCTKDVTVRHFATNILVSIFAQYPHGEFEAAPECNGGGKGEIPEKTRPPMASSGTSPPCENPMTRPGIEPGSPWWEASELTAQPQRPLPCGFFTLSSRKRKCGGRCRLLVGFLRVLPIPPQLPSIAAPPRLQKPHFSHSLTSLGSFVRLAAGSTRHPRVCGGDGTSILLLVAFWVEFSPGSEAGSWNCPPTAFFGRRDVDSTNSMMRSPEPSEWASSHPEEETSRQSDIRRGQGCTNTEQRAPDEGEARRVAYGGKPECKGEGKLETREKTGRPASSSGTITTCEDPLAKHTQLSAFGSHD